jgi:hypothetical protein
VIDPPRDPIVYLLWRAWLALSRARVSAIHITLRDTSVLHLAMRTETHKALRIRATADPDPGETERREVDVPGPILWTVSDETVIRIDQTEGTSTTVYALAPGAATLTAKAGELKDAASITVTERPATQIEIVEWSDPLDLP